MIQTFDSYGLYEPPSFILCNPDKSELYSLGQIRERKYMPRYNGLGKVSFIADAYVDKVKAEYYDSLEYRRLIYLEDLGYFMITTISTDGDGVTETKEIEAESLEVELSTKKISSFTGTYKFWDLLDTAPTLLGHIITYLPGWTIGTISSSLLSIYRTFDISDSTIYNFLMQDVENAYQCIFYFDTINNTINAYTVSEATHTTDIYLSYDNLIKSININEKTDELVTALSVYGGGGLSINVVNPLGTPTIYDFSHFLSTDWMSQGLLTGITDWNVKCAAKQTEYSGSATNLLDQYTILGNQEAVLSEYQAELAALETTKSANIAAGESLAPVNALIAAKQIQITAQTGLVAATNATIDDIILNLNAISDYLSFSTNFTQSQLTELSPFIIGSTYNNENIIETDSMSASTIQIQAQYLFDQAEDILAKVAQPRYEFKVESGNFVFTEDFAPFISELVLGATITLEMDNNLTSIPALLGLDLNYDAPEEFSLIFGNRLRLDDSSYALADLLNESFNSSIDTKFNSEEWNNWSQHKDSVTNFITSSLDTAVNNLISGSAKSILIDQSGIRIRQSTGIDTYSPNQMWMNNGVLAFSDDAFETSKLALGQINVNGNTVYGLVADAIVGHLIAGNELTISNSNALTGETTFEVSGSLVRITNGYFSLRNKDNTSIITIDPDFGIKIDKILPGGSIENQLYLDGSGNLIFKGNISGATGTFTGSINATSGFIDGWEIRDNGLWDTNGNYIRSDGKIRLGALDIDGSNARFSGTFYANKLEGYVQGNQIGSVWPSSMTAGTLTGVNIWGGTIYFGGTMSNPAGMLSWIPTGVATLTAPSIQLNKPGGYGASLDLNTNAFTTTGAFLYSPTDIYIGGTTNDSQTDIKFLGNIWSRGLRGVSGTFPVGENTIEITEGIITHTTIDGEVGLLGDTWTLAEGAASGIVITRYYNPGRGKVAKMSGSSFTIASNTAIGNASGFALSLDNNQWLVFGVATVGSWTAGGLLYLGVNGSMTQVVPTGSNVVAQILGVALSSTKIFFNPSLVQVEML